MSIPPRPWRVVSGGDGYDEVYAADGQAIAVPTSSAFKPGVADLVVRLVNAEPDIVAALEAAASLGHGADCGDCHDGLCRIGRSAAAALAKVRP